MALAVAFDTLKLVRKLEAAGFEHQQAADVSEAMAEAFAIAEVATKADIDRLAAANKADLREAHAATMAAISDVKTETMAAIADVKTALRESEHRQAIENAAIRSDMKAENVAMRADMKAESTAVRSDMKAMELRMTIKLGVMLAALFATTVGAVAA
ncbi:MAG: hypothetical protein FD149_2463, partial [Rhodospirillaceae bacterium]